MKHLDEGTIHAWLDGALDAAQSREIEAHVAQCAACSAAVAEARGLVAASSRILTALDEVPGGVLPKRAVPPVKRSRFQWRAAPWVSAIAATLVIAVGVATLKRDSATTAFAPLAADSAQVAAAPQPIAIEAAKKEPTQPTATRQSAPPVPVPSVVASVGNKRMDAVRETTLRRPSDLGAADRAGAAAELRRRELASAPASGAGGVPAAAAEIAEQRNDKMMKAAAPAPAPAIPTTRGELDRIAATAAPEAGGVRSPEQIATARFAGCYRVVSPAGAVQPFAAAQKVAGGVARASGARDSRAPSAAAAPAAEYTAPLPTGGIIRLDTLRHPLGFTARNASTETSIGNWRTVGADSARVDLLTAGLYTVALRNKVACPER